MAINRQDRLRPLWQGLLIAVAIGAISLLLYYCVFVLPEILYPPLTDDYLNQQGVPDGDKRVALRDARLKLQNDSRTTLLQGVGALLVLSGAAIGAAVTLRQVRITREQLEVTRSQAHQSQSATLRQLEISERGQITDRFIRAVEHLGHGEANVRVGALFALARVANDSPDDRRAVGEIVVSYLHRHSPWPPALPSQPPAGKMDTDFPRLIVRAPDLQAAIRVLGQLDLSAEFDILDLGHLDLRRAELHKVTMKWALFYGSHLEMATMTDSDFSMSDFYLAHLQGAYLLGSDFEHADFDKANLAEAHADNRTTWPEGFDPTTRGVVLKGNTDSSK